jgi:hypothetical protein
VNPVIQHREWLIQPEALQSMAASLRGFVDRGGLLPHQDEPDSPLLSIDDGGVPPFFEPGSMRAFVLV